MSLGISANGSAPCQLRSLAGQEHGWTFPLGDVSLVLPNVCFEEEWRKYNRRGNSFYCGPLCTAAATTISDCGVVSNTRASAAHPKLRPSLEQRLY